MMSEKRDNEWALSMAHGSTVLIERRNSEVNDSVIMSLGDSSVKMTLEDARRLIDGLNTATKTAHVHTNDKGRLLCTMRPVELRPGASIYYTNDGFPCVKCRKIVNEHWLS